MMASLDRPELQGLAQLSKLVGNTSLLAIHAQVRGQKATIYAKYESANFSGSIKDRMALHILGRALEQGQLKPGDTIVEATSGNTGIAFAALGRALGHPVTIMMPDWMSRERVTIIQSFGATVVPVSAAEGGFVGSIQRAEEMAQERDDVFLPSQFANQANVAAHATSTGPEILAQLATIGRAPTAFVAGVGTGGTAMGVAEAFRASGSTATIHPLEPSNSPTLRTGCKVGKHRIQGVSDEFIPAIVELDSLDEIIDVRDGDAICMAQQLAQQAGLAVGISSGANFLGALQLAMAQGPGAVVTTVFSDCNKKYLSTDYVSDEPTLPDDLTPEVKIDSFDVLQPACLECPSRA